VVVFGKIIGCLLCQFQLRFWFEFGCIVIAGSQSQMYKIFCAVYLLVVLDCPEV
jgi:hypothetical protein